MKSLLVSFVCVLVTTFTAYAQPADESIGIGVSTGWHQGANITYVINQDMHFSFQLGVHINNGEGHPTIAPQLRYFLAHKGNFHPYAVGSVYFSEGGMKGQAYDADMGILAGVGASYFPTKDINVYGQISVADIALQSSNTGSSFGILMPSVGIEWFVW
jgi:hypothetical protein